MANNEKNAGVGKYPVGAIIQALRQLNPLYKMLPEGTYDFPRDFFIYNQIFNPLLAGQTATTQIAIQADSDFLIVAGVIAVRDGATGLVLQAGPPITVQIEDSGSGRSFQFLPDDVGNVFGTAQLPGYWPTPKFIKRSSTISTIMTNLDGANDFIVRYAFWGMKVFPNRAYNL